MKNALVIRSLAGFGLVLFVLSAMPSVMHSWRMNLIALHLSESFANATGQFSWSNLQWWQSPCEPQASNPMPQNQEDLAVRRSRQESRLAALSRLAAGDCMAATRILDQIQGEVSPDSPEQIVLAYLYSMQGAWEQAAEAFSLTHVPRGLWATRNYWADVALRAAESASTDNPSASIQYWLTMAEELAAHQTWRGSQALADYWEQSNRPIERFEELRRALAFVESDTAYAVADEYIQARAAYTDQGSGFDGNSRETLANASAINASNVSQGVELLYLPPAPDWELEYVWNEHWRLIGVDADRIALALGPLVETTFFWTYTAIPGAAPKYVADHRLAYNLIPDAGFEWLPASQHVRPFGYLPRLYAEPPPLPYEIARSGDNQYFCLLNTENSPNTGVLTAWRKLTSGRAGVRILQGGMFRTMEGGKAHIGWRWRSNEDDQVHFAHLVQGEQASDWKRAAQVWEIPAGADQVAFHLLQFQNQGQACFDELFAFELRTPEVTIP